MESDPRWHGQGRYDRRLNQTLILAEDRDDDVTAIDRGSRRCDGIVIDGRHRRACAVAALPRLERGGLVILDNSDWYPATAVILRKEGLIQVDFTGLGPANRYAWATSLFLRRDVDLKPLAAVQPRHGIGSLVQVADPE